MRFVIRRLFAGEGGRIIPESNFGFHRPPQASVTRLHMNHLNRREFVARLSQLGITCSLGGVALSAHSAESPRVVPDPLLIVPDYQRPKGHIIHVSDQQLLDLQDPDKEVDLSLAKTPHVTTLRKICEQTRARGANILVVAFDAFWEQYRPGQKGKPRELTPDSEAYIQCLARISQTAKAYGLGLELSLLSPLEIGAGYSRKTGESGRWVQYREGWRDPKTGQFTVSLWQQLRWGNNKGIIELKRTGVRAFAFREQRVAHSSFYQVDPSGIIALHEPLEIETAEPESPTTARCRLTIRGRGDTAVGPLDRVLVVVSYQTPEMDYFSPKALPFLKDLVEGYRRADIPLLGLYSDEVHIQQDWNYFGHHDEGQFTFRFLTPNLARQFAEKYGAEFADFEKWLVYFCYAQHGFHSSLEARLPAQHVVGPSVADIQKTFLLRRRYYDLLDRTVVSLFQEARAHAEKLYNHKLVATAHATWAESPTIDFWRSNHPRRTNGSFRYEYTPGFLWSNTVQQAAAACDDYFRWGEFLTGGGTDHAEGGWSDRDYYGLAMACSLGSINPHDRYAYAAGWGWPGAVGQRYQILQNAFGAGANAAFQAIEEREHRAIEVLMLYPLSLVACEERFGSWMTQYGYANYITPEKLLELGHVTTDGQIEICGRRFGTLAVQFEPLPPPGLLPFLGQFVQRGGRLIWSGPPPYVDMSGQPVLDQWQQLCGVKSLEFDREGIMAAGCMIEFAGPLANAPAQTILTDFLVDHTYPVQPAAGVHPVAQMGGDIVGVHRAIPNAGSVTFLGFRPRDDQSASLGYETRTWFEILKAFGAYPKSRPNLAFEDNPSVVSRETPYLATRFPNGTIAVAAHYRTHNENWSGGIHRDAQQDQATLAKGPLPSDQLELRDFRVAGHALDFTGRQIVAFRLDEQQRLIAFGGYDCSSIRIDDREYAFADRTMSHVAWAPLPLNRRVAGGAIMELWVQGEGKLKIPLPENIRNARVFLQGASLGSAGTEIAVSATNGILELQSQNAWGHAHLYVVPV